MKFFLHLYFILELILVQVLNKFTLTVTQVRFYGKNSTVPCSLLGSDIKYAHVQKYIYHCTGFHIVVACFHESRVE